MNKLIVQVCLMFVCGLKLNSLSAQETMTAAGGNASGTGGSVSYSIGQLIYTTNIGANGSLAQGIQQAYEVSVINGIEQTKDITLQCSAYPNPAADYLILKIEGELKSKYIASLYDVNGKLLENTLIESNETRIDMHNLVPATYFLRVVQTKQTSSLQNSSQQEIKTFKIIKN